MRRMLILGLAVASLLVACQPDPSFTQTGPRLVEERAIDGSLLPTLAVFATDTPVVVPTTVAVNATESSDQGDAAVPLPTQGDFIFVTPTLPPSKTPTTTPTATVPPTNTPPVTNTVPPTTTALPTSSQFAFSGQGGTSPLEATAYAQGLLAAQNPYIQLTGTPNPARSGPAAQCGSTTWLNNTALPVCPTGSAGSGQVVYLPFEFGYMIWVEETDLIYVMFDDNSQPRWLEIIDPYIEGAPERDYSWPERQPPQSWQPRRGFGEVWRRSEEVRGRIGWSLQEWETIYYPQYQTGTDGSFLVQEPRGNLFYLYPDGTDWELIRVG